MKIQSISVEQNTMYATLKNKCVLGVAIANVSRLDGMTSGTPKEERNLTEHLNTLSITDLLNVLFSSPKIEKVHTGHDRLEIYFDNGNQVFLEFSMLLQRSKYKGLAQNDRIYYPQPHTDRLTWDGGIELSINDILLLLAAESAPADTSPNGGARSGLLTVDEG